MSMKSKLLIFAATLAFFGVIGLYIHEFQWFQNYLHPTGMVVGSLLFGALVGLGSGFYFQRRGEELVDRIQIWTVCLVLGVLPMPLLASLANRIFAEQTPTQTQAQFWQSSKHIIKGGVGRPIFILQDPNKQDVVGYFIFLIVDGEMVRVESKTPRFEGVQQGDMVTVPVRKGLLGVDFVQWED
jgi:hypothetical protein